MRIPAKPPVLQTLYESALEKGGQSRYLEIVTRPIGPAPDGKYRHWDVVRRLDPPQGLTSEDWWLGIKLARNHLYQDLPLKDRAGNPFKYAVLDIVLRMLHQIDRDAGGAIKGSDLVIDPTIRDTYLIKSLIEESITSSQLEGAATTREVAKDMLRQGRKPRDRSEQMIYNNYRAMRFILKLADRPLTPNIILELQQIVTEKTLDDPTAAGRLRSPDESIHVADETGQILHIPPDANELPQRIEELCDFANSEDETTFRHPVVRAILLHFWIAYDHPFVDGNGRTARALFYWAMAKDGYWLCEYLSISRIINEGPAKYARSFLYTETDDNDVTYFIIHQLSIIIRAIEELHAYLERKSEELRATELLLRQSHALRAVLNYRQLAVVNHALKNPYFTYTFESHRGSHNISYQTARTDLLTLADFELLDRSKDGKTIIFVAPPDLHDRVERLRDAEHR